MRHVLFLLTLSVTAMLAGCPSTRTSAATQPTPAAFQPAASDPKALEIVDAALLALNAGDKWAKVKELRFEVKYSTSGTLQARFEHSWDLWNGRHALKTANMATIENREDDIKWHDVRYDIFKTDVIFWASYAKEEKARSDYAAAAEQARVRLREDGYRFTMVYKLRDPGVKLTATGALAPSAGVCEPSCNTVKVSFDPAVGTDTWYVHFNKNSNLPEIMEQETSKGRLAYRIANWVEVGGLKWPTLLSNIRPGGDTFEFTGIAVGEPRGSTYGRDR
jgi:hypothetical protein